MTPQTPKRPHDTGNRPLEVLQLGLLAAYAIYYLWLAFGTPIELVVNGTIDDSYYYLEVARNLAAGLGSTFDGTAELTNGYHPLWMGLLVPLYALVHDPELGLRCALLISGAFGTGMLLILRRVLNRAVGKWGGTVMLVLFAWPRFFGLTQNVLETALLLFLYAWIFRLFVSGRLDSTHRRVGLGLLLGLAMLARLDTVFLIFSVGCWVVWEWGRGRTLWRALSVDHSGGEPPTSSQRPLASSWGRFRSHLPLACAAIPVLPYLVWNLVVFHHLQPVSGAMKTSFPDPGIHLRPFRDFPEYLILILVALGISLWGLSRASSRYTRGLWVFSFAALLHAVYTAVFMVWAVDRWHFALLVFLGLTALPVLGQRILDRLPSPVAWTGIGVAIVGAVAVQFYSFGLRHGRYQADTYAVSIWVRDHVPSDAVLAATDSGVLAYFSERSTVNLDGLINSFDYLEILRRGNGAVETYLRRKGVGYLLDQVAYDLDDVLSGTYESRRIRIAYKPGSRIAAEFIVRPEDEVYRRNTLCRRDLGSAQVEPNAIILYRIQP
ncbi:MAG: hypothetical protein KC729_00240 [Candidatus Eisenbacteria bacterium]|uniref:Glycosyltransferase RgtA/B/C/D-like domain-containing protein n=1 Tax=Eiseniibacteriota bacterium TaxID=2212470 RepID=A0A956LV70_UNCEI|nr:hypothetical protein [Candidatus Eisenbacteria bacterium]